MKKIVCCAYLAASFILAAPVWAEDNCKHFDFSLEQIAQMRLNQFPPDFYHPWQGLIIRNIKIEADQVFDLRNPDENNFLYRSLNKLHINTRPAVIKAQLLFKEGEPFSEEKIKETDRILRSRGYLANAYIVPEQVCDNMIDLRVVTRDSWTTEPETSISSEGGETKSGFALSEKNFLGTGTAFSIGYEKLPERQSVSYEVSSPHIFNTHYAAEILYADKTDGADKIFEISKPFYSLATPWSYGFSTSDITETQYIRARRKVIDEYSHELVRQEVFVGHAFDVSEHGTQRISAGFAHDRDIFRTTPITVLALPHDREDNYPWLAYRYIENEFGVFKNLRQIQRMEDVATGKDFYLRMGYSGNTFDSERDTIILKSQFTDSKGVFDHHLLEFASGFDARVQPEGAAPDSGLAYAKLSYNYFISEKQRWYLSARYDRGQNLESYEEVTLGGLAGLRGYPLDFQRGDQSYVLTLERRYFADSHIFNLLRYGLVAFAETGKAWGSEYDQNDTTLSNVGIGLRLSSSKARVGSVVHIDYSVPTAARSEVGGGQWVITTTKEF